MSQLENEIPTSASFSETRLGLAAGGGIETALGAKWSAKLEYLYVNFGNWTNATGPINFGVGGFGSPVVIQENLHDHIVRVGLNYKL